MPDTLYVTVIMSCLPNQVETLLDAASKFRTQSLKEKDCECFIITQSLDDPTKIIFFEVYKDHKAFEYHQEQAYTQNYTSMIADDLATSIDFHMSKSLNMPD